MVRAPNVGNVTGSGEAVQDAAGQPFTLDGKQYVFGQAGLAEQLTSFGDGLRIEEKAPNAQFIMAGDVLVTNVVK